MAALRPVASKFLIPREPLVSTVERFRKDVEHLLAEINTLLERCPDPEDEQWPLDVETVIYNAIRAGGLLDRVPAGFPLIQEIAERVGRLYIVQNILPDPAHWSPRKSADGWTCIRELQILTSRLEEMLERLPSPKNEGSGRPARPTQHKNSVVYSRADDTRFRRIGRASIELLTNRELWKRQKREEQRLRPGTTINAFRQSLNRIRAHYGLPASKDLQKKK